MTCPQCARRKPVSSVEVSPFPCDRCGGPMTGSGWEEEWRPVPGYHGVYEVSDQGRVRSLDRVTVDTLGRSRPFKGKILNPSAAGNPPYPSVALRGTGFRVHALVLLAFRGPRPEGLPLVRHINGDRNDNRLENLAYGTYLENLQDARDHGVSHFAVWKTVCCRGHELTEDNVIWSKSRPGQRNCKACNQIRSRRSKERRSIERARRRVAS